MQLQALNWLNIAQISSFSRRQTYSRRGSRYSVDGCKVKIMGTAMFYSPIYTILLVVIHSSKNKTEKVDGFAVIFDGIQLSQMANNFQI